MFNNFYNKKTVLVTGHTGFKGAWLALWLHHMGANVIGFALEPGYDQSLFEKAKLGKKINSVEGDIRDYKKLNQTIANHKPDIIFHLAAQAIVRTSYDDPLTTFSTNVMGTANVIEAARQHNVKSTVIITSDKCYLNVEQTKGYVESDALSTQDPYSTSKACAEMVAQSYRYSYDMTFPTTRAGNVIGGGDWAEDRLIPDGVRALQKNKPIVIRNPESTRPWQFVLEPLYGYLLLGKMQFEGKDVNGGWNFGPEPESIIPVKDVVELLISKWGSGKVHIESDKTKKEAGLLYLDISKAKKELGWTPKLSIEQTMDYIVQWYQYTGDDVDNLCIKQIESYYEQ